MKRYPTYIPVAEPNLGGNELKYVTDCVKSGWISSLGKYVGQFEENFATFCGSKYGISACNGTVAIHLALVALGIGRGDEVIVPSLTFVATANSVLYTGAKPVFVDSEMSTWNIDPSEIEKKITKKTKAIIVVHLYGHPAKMDEIMKIARKHNLSVIEDAAEAHGAMYKKKRVGSIADIGCFSFYGNKTLTTGEGGMITTNKKKLANDMRFLKDHAMSATKRYYHPKLGYNYRITNIEAALGVAQLEKAEVFLKKKREIALKYTKLLQDIPSLLFPPEESWAKNSYWMYSIVLKPGTKIRRANFMQKLKELNIDSRPFFIPNHTFPYFEGSKKKDQYPVATFLGANGVNLPSSVLLKNEQIEFISEAIHTLLQ